MTEAEKAVVERLDRIYNLLAKALGVDEPLRIEVRQNIRLDRSVLEDDGA